MDGSLVWKNQHHQSGTLMPLGAVHPIIGSHQVARSAPDYSLRESTHASAKQSIAIRTTSPHSVQGAELVAVNITQIGEIELPRRAFPHTRWVFAGSSAVCDADRMPSVSLLSRTGGKADRAAIGRSRRFAIDRLGY